LRGLGNLESFLSIKIIRGRLVASRARKRVGHVALAGPLSTTFRMVRKFKVAEDVAKEKKSMDI